MIPEAAPHRAVCARCRRPRRSATARTWCRWRRARASCCCSTRASGTSPSGPRAWRTSVCPTPSCTSASTSTTTSRCAPRSRGPTGGPAYLLFPGPQAIDLAEARPAGPITLVVVDGTWWQARKLLKRNALLAALPQLRFTPPAPSNYRIRREPADHCVATVEALAQVLGALEEATRRGSPRCCARSKPWSTRSSATRRRCAARASATPSTARGGRGARRAVAAARPRGRPALRPRRGQRLAGAARRRPPAGDRPLGGAPRRAPARPSRRSSPRAARWRRRSPATSAFRRARWRRARAGSFRARWAAFVREGDVVCAWGRYPLDVLEAEGVALPAARLDLRPAAGTYLGARTGTVEECAARMGLAAGAAVRRPGAGARGWRRCRRSSTGCWRCRARRLDALLTSIRRRSKSALWSQGGDAGARRRGGGRVAQRRGDRAARARARAGRAADGGPLPDRERVGVRLPLARQPLRARRGGGDRPRRSPGGRRERRLRATARRPWRRWGRASATASPAPTEPAARPRARRADGGETPLGGTLRALLADPARAAGLQLEEADLRADALLETGARGPLAPGKLDALLQVLAGAARVTSTAWRARSPRRSSGRRRRSPTGRGARSGWPSPPTRACARSSPRAWSLCEEDGRLALHRLGEIELGGDWLQHLPARRDVRRRRLRGAPDRRAPRSGAADGARHAQRAPAAGGARPRAAHRARAQPARGRGGRRDRRPADAGLRLAPLRARRRRRSWSTCAARCRCAIRPPSGAPSNACAPSWICCPAAAPPTAPPTRPASSRS